VKSRTGNTTGKLFKDASMMLCVGHSIAANMTGNISVAGVLAPWARYKGPASGKR
jgi:hypothetical protein